MKQRWWVLAAMATSICIIFLDQSILPVALPTIARELTISELGMQWLINAYLLTLAAFVLAAGRIGDMFGHRRIFCFGMVLFMFSSISCGFSQSSLWFIFSRAIQGIGGALIIPTASPILLNSFPEEQRGRVMGIYVSIGALFLSLGPVFGGLITQFWHWRYIFWINVPIILLGLALTYLVVPRSERREESFDFLGFAATSLGIIGIITGLMQGRDWGWTYWPVPTMIFIGLFLLLAFAFFERDVKDPFVDFKLFRKKTYIGANGCVFAMHFMLTLTIFWAVYFQTVLHYSPAFAGLWAMIANSPLVLFSHVSGYLLDRFGPKLPVVTGFLLSITGILWFLFLPTPSSPWLLLPMVILFGCGIPMVFLPCFTVSMSEVPKEKRGVAVGINMTVRQCGATLGMAIFGQIFLVLHSTFFAKRLAADPATASLDPKIFEGLLAQSKLSNPALEKLPSDIATKLINDYLTSSIWSTQLLNLCGILIALGGLACALFFFRWGHYSRQSK